MNRLPCTSDMPGDFGYHPAFEQEGTVTEDSLAEDLMDEAEAVLEAGEGEVTVAPHQREMTAPVTEEIAQHWSDEHSKLLLAVFKCCEEPEVVDLRHALAKAIGSANAAGVLEARMRGSL